MINLDELKKIKASMLPDLNEFAKQIAEVQPMPDNLVKDILDAIGDKTLVLRSKNPEI